MSDVVLVGLAAVLGIAVGRQIRFLVAPYGVALPARLPAAEMACAVLFGLATYRYDQGWRTVPVLVLCAACVALAIVDFAVYRLPNAFLFPAIIASVSLIVVGEAIDGNAGRAGHVLTGALVYAGMLFVLHLVNPAGLGFGDVKLAILLGVFLGWVANGGVDAVRAVMLAVIVGSALGVVLGVSRMVAVRFGRRFLPDPLVAEGDEAVPLMKTTLPFGPPLMVGTIAIVLWPATFLG